MSITDTLINHENAASDAERSEASLTALNLQRMRTEFEGNRANHIAQNAVTQSPLDDVALNRAVLAATDHSFSHILDDWAVTNQKQTGRCWMFAGLNLFRVGAMRKMGIKEFEFSQNYTQFCS